MPADCTDDPKDKEPGHPWLHLLEGQLQLRLVDEQLRKQSPKQRVHLS